MANLTKYEKVVQEHICLYMYSIWRNKFRIFNDARLVKNTMISGNPLYYVHHYDYSGSDSNPEYIVSPNAGEVLHSNGGIFKVWFTKADDAVGTKSLLDAIDIYIAERIKAASNTIATMKKQQDMAHETLDFKK